MGTNGKSMQCIVYLKYFKQCMFLIFACWVIIYTFVVVCLLFESLRIQNKSFRNTIMVSNGSDPDPDRYYVILIWVQTVCKGYPELHQTNQGQSIPVSDDSFLASSDFCKSRR